MRAGAERTEPLARTPKGPADKRLSGNPTRRALFHQLGALCVNRPQGAHNRLEFGGDCGAAVARFPGRKIRWIRAEPARRCRTADRSCPRRSRSRRRNARCPGRECRPPAVIRSTGGRRRWPTLASCRSASSTLVSTRSSIWTFGSAVSSLKSWMWSRAFRAEYPASSRNGRQIAIRPFSSQPAISSARSGATPA